jgi:hypothetical protein
MSFHKLPKEPGQTSRMELSVRQEALPLSCFSGKQSHQVFRCSSGQLVAKLLPQSYCCNMSFAAGIAYLEFRTMPINPQELWLLLNNQFSKFWKLNDFVSGAVRAPTHWRVA